jgi:hypothetical protein
MLKTLWVSQKFKQRVRSCLIASWRPSFGFKTAAWAASMVLRETVEPQKNEDFIRNSVFFSLFFWMYKW